MRFLKMHGIGNDYIFFDCLSSTIENPSALSKRLSDRHFGIGGDGVVLIEPSSAADFRMRIFNADGSEAEMCGNAIRCVGKYLYDNRISQSTEISVETGAGILILWLNIENEKVSSVRVDMGEPVLEGTRIPTTLDQPRVVAHPLEVGGQSLSVTCVSMGNPHCVTFVEEITDELVLGLGPKVEVHPLFPNRVNVEFVRVLGREKLQMRVWERGSGETMACGTGACAVAVAAALNDLAERKVTIHLLGGDLEIEWAADNHVYKTGPAAFVFEGEVEI